MVHNFWSIWVFLSSGTGPFKTCISFLVACIVLKYLNMHACVNYTTQRWSQLTVVNVYAVENYNTIWTLKEYYAVVYCLKLHALLRRMYSTSFSQFSINCWHLNVLHICCIGYLGKWIFHCMFIVCINLFVGWSNVFMWTAY